VAAATALSNACDSANITEGLDPIKMLSQEVANRWQVMTTVVEQKKNVIDSVQQQLKQYEDALEKIEHLLNRTEATLVSQSATGADVNKAKVNRDTLKVSGGALCLVCGGWQGLLCVGCFFYILAQLRILRTKSLLSQRIIKQVNKMYKTKLCSFPVNCNNYNFLKCDWCINCCILL